MDFSKNKPGDKCFIELTTKLFVEADGAAWLSEKVNPEEDAKIYIAKKFWGPVEDQLVATFGWGVCFSARVKIKGKVSCLENKRLEICEVSELIVEED